MGFNQENNSNFKTKYAVIIVIFLLFFAINPQIAAARQNSAHVISHTIRISLDPAAKSMEGIDEIEVANDAQDLVLYIRAGSKILRVTSNGRVLPYRVMRSKDPGLKIVSIKLSSIKSGSGAKKVTIGFSGRFQGMEQASIGIKRGVAYLDDGVIDTDGAILPSSSNWYPREEVLSAKTTVIIAAPPGFTSISEGDWAGSVKNGTASVDTWRIDHPIDGADVITARFEIEKETYKGIDIYTFFLEKDPSLSRTYIDKTKEYLDLYSDMIGQYPYAKFAVVESALPTGYGMPSFTLLGSSVLRLPFIPDTSLGHETAHNWWGNSVFADETSGNWTEAIATYTADYAFAVKKGAQDAEDFRLTKLIGFKGFAIKEGPLKEFKHSTEAGARAVGYNKGFFLFVMLKQEIGAEAFSAGLKRFYGKNKFRKATWRDIQKAFECASGRKLGRFFDQWLNLPGGPSISLVKAEVIQNGESGYTLKYTISQGPSTYSLQVPVLVNLATEGASKTDSIYKTNAVLDAQTMDFELHLDARPVSIELDPNNEVFRILDDTEVPPTLSGFLSDNKGIIVIPDENKAAYMDAARIIQKDYPKEVATYSDARLAERINSRSALVIVPLRHSGDGSGVVYDLIRRFANNEQGAFAYNGASFFNDNQETLTCLKNPLDKSRTTCFLTIKDAPEIILDTIRRLRYFGDWSRLTFSGKIVLDKARFKGQKKLYLNLRQD